MPSHCDPAFPQKKGWGRPSCTEEERTRPAPGRLVCHTPDMGHARAMPLLWALFCVWGLGWDRLGSTQHRPPVCPPGRGLKDSGVYVKGPQVSACCILNFVCHQSRRSRTLTLSPVHLGCPGWQRTGQASCCLGTAWGVGEGGSSLSPSQPMMVGDSGHFIGSAFNLSQTSAALDFVSSHSFARRCI